MYSLKEVEVFLKQELILLKQKVNSYTKIIEINDKGFIISSILRETIHIEDTFEGFFILNGYKNENYDLQLVRFLYGYLFKTGSLDFIEKSFVDLYEEFDHYIKTGEFLFRNVSFVDGCILNVDGIIPFEDFNFSKANKEYLQLFYNKFMFNKDVRNRGSHYGDHKSNPVCMAVNTYYSKDFNPDISLREHLVRFGKAMLLNEGIVKKIEIKPCITFCYLNGVSRYEYINEINGNTNVKFTLSDITGIQKIYKYLKEINGKIIAVDRLVSAHSKNGTDDKFLDLMIALESLFPNVKAEVTFRLSLYIGAFFKDIEYYKKLKTIYSKRSNIVHGSSEYESNQLLSDVLYLDEVVRRLTLEGINYLINGKNLKDFENDILESIFSNSKQ